MPPELLKAHRNLDRAVRKLYGFTPQNTPTEADCVAKLLELYQALTGKSVCDDYPNRTTVTLAVQAFSTHRKCEIAELELLYSCNVVSGVLM